MRLKVFQGPLELARAAAEHAAFAIRDAIAKTGRARVVAASAASQIQFLSSLVDIARIDWRRVELFQLDEYIGLPTTHQASFCRFLQAHLVSRAGIPNYFSIQGDGDVQTVIERAGRVLTASPIDVAFVGIGENGHLAFNDPPADFESDEPYLVVALDEACRRQQVDEGWFASLDEVPSRAISMSIRQILTAKEIIAVVPDLRKAQAVKACLESEIDPERPASILRTHGSTTIYLDQQSASLLARVDPEFS